MENWTRVATPEKLVGLAPGARCWEKEIKDGVLRVLRTVERDNDRQPWRTHVSISHRTKDGKPGRYPTWDEQKEAVWRFAPGKAMMSLLPPEGDFYVNVHVTTFHWWETTTEVLHNIS